MTECANCEVHRFIACKNGLGGCSDRSSSASFRTGVSPLYSANEDPSSSSTPRFNAGKRAGNPYDDVQERIKTALKKIQDLQDQEEIDELKAIVEAGAKYFKLEAEVNQFLNLKSAIAKLKEQLKPRSIGEEFIRAARSAGAERPFLAQLLEKHFERWNDLHG